MHEAAHWFLATPAERRFANFGLGPSMLDRYPWDPNKDPYETHEQLRAERVASALGIRMERAIGLDWLATAADHEWGLEFDRDVKPQTMLRLLRTESPGIHVSRRGVPFRVTT